MNKRVILSILLGLCAGIICIIGAEYIVKVKTTMTFKIAGIINRTLIGLFIGITYWKMNKYVSAAIIGGIMSVQLAIFFKVYIAIANIAAGIIYGLLIELILTKIFKIKKESLL